MENEEGYAPAATLVVHGLAPLKVLSDPLRMRIIEVLRGGPATVRQLAALLEVPPRSLYYHINLLERHGMVRVISTRMVSGIVEKTYRATAHVFLFADLVSAGSTNEPAEMNDALDSLFRSTREELAESVRADRVNPIGKSFADSGYQLEWNLLALTAEEAATLAARIEALLEEYRHPETGADQPARETFRMLFTLFRTYPRGGGALEHD